MQILVVGAGVAGLVCASRLAAAGRPVTVVDKRGGVGGRLATKLVGGARMDSGAQFFTVRHADFAAVVERWLASGTAREWCRGFQSPPDGHPRYIGATGMTDLAEDLAAGLDVRTSTRLASIAPSPGGGWSARLGDGDPLTGSTGEVFVADAVVCTAPVPQSLDLLAQGGVGLPPDKADALAAIRYEPTLAGLVVLDGPSAVPAPGGVQLAEGALSWVGDNQAKGISAVPALTLHARGDLSAELWSEGAAAALEVLVEEAAAWMGPAAPLETELVRWRYATPAVLHHERCLVAVDGSHPIVCAGDAFGEARVEGAARSGLAAADAVLSRLG